ncbi:Flagellar hook-associated protein 2 [Sporomusa rhizae]|uniref:flagellar filament capping protein FliD n=1 Tax=Sporomusa rhizae TaxID=357999 RepID=UPI003529EFCF
MALRTYGLSGSGMDVDQMVKDMMKAQRARYDTLVQKKTKVEWKKEDFNTMYTTIKGFRDTVSTYKLSNMVSPKSVSSNDEKVIQATANADAANITHSLEVKQLAKGVSLTSAGANASPAAATDTITTGASKDTLANQFTGLTGTFKIKIANGKLSKEITIDTSKSIYQAVSDINNAGINVKANYDASLDRFFLSTTDTGANTTLDFTGSDAKGKDFLQNNLKLCVDPTKNKGQDATIILDNVEINQPNNSFTISDVTYNLKGEGKANVAVAPDNAKTLANVKAFVDAYNGILDKINSELKEDRYKDYLPLTDEQKKQLSESQIKAWETKARSGILRRDPILQQSVNQMRNAVYSPVSGVSGKYTSLASIGITTGLYTEGGKLHIDDENKLKKAIEEDPDVINKLFTANGSTSSTQGVAYRLYDSLKGAMDKIGREAGYSAGISDDTKSTLANEIRDYNSQINTLSKRLATMEDNYYRKFNAMEVALGKIGKQSSWLTSQLGG